MSLAFTRLQRGAGVLKMDRPPFQPEPPAARQPRRLSRALYSLPPSHPPSFSPPLLPAQLPSPIPAAPLKITVTFCTCQSKRFPSFPRHPSSSAVLHQYLALPIERLYFPPALSEDGAVTERAGEGISLGETASLAFACTLLSPSSCVKETYTMDSFFFLFFSLLTKDASFCCKGRIQFNVSIFLFSFFLFLSAGRHSRRHTR